jgi:uncharacterized membrane protein
VNEPGESGLERGTDLERTQFFSDGVFAIAITLLALDIRLPDTLAGPEAEDLPGALVALLPEFVSFLISFWVIGTYWLAHHRTFHYIRGYDRRLLLINLFFLMWIVLLPFSSTVIGEYGNRQIAAVIYAANAGIAGLSLAWVWRHASRDPRLMDVRNVDAREFQYNQLRALTVPLVFVLSIGVSFISVHAAELFWLLAFLIRPVLLKITHRSAA